MKKSLKIFATSKWFDLFGVTLVVGIAIASGYLNSRLDKFVDWGPWTALVPFGLISVTNVGISMLSTRFTGKLSKWGNYFGIVNTILSGAIDYILGNKAAIITYPVTFLIYTFAIKKWEASQEGRPNQMSQKQLKLAAIIISIIAFLFAFVTNYIGYGGKMNLLAYVTTIAFALSLIANAFNALKLTTQWGFWLIYNFVQLTKAGIQGNFANIGKYIFYILNAIGALFVWNDEEVEQ
ncbi:nicotinamide mononucleotide transporter [Streptococcus gwangjuense]|uniref:nicotinamide mononucleotide transporter n=1 Tax=Streptococcus gwangjuensis TaxID=1433513 RepID=UPI002304F8DD|nr:nicotinamide mononucleotide transporter [Streptococcus gwangjuense]MDB0075325.1 nicotinamide mononucleotide transporter family protein [Streptococcus gwangjuense]